MNHSQLKNRKDLNKHMVPALEAINVLQHMEEGGVDSNLRRKMSPLWHNKTISLTQCVHVISVSLFKKYLSENTNNIKF